MRAGLDREIVSRLGGGVVDAYLKHWKTTLQFNRAVLSTFLGAELSLQATIDFEGETGFGQFDRLAGHSESVVVGGMVSGLVTASPAWPTRLFEGRLYTLRHKGRDLVRWLQTAAIPRRKLARPTMR
jgi:hypothetical protein